MTELTALPSTFPGGRPTRRWKLPKSFSLDLMTNLAIWQIVADSDVPAVKAMLIKELTTALLLAGLQDSVSVVAPIKIGGPYSEDNLFLPKVQFRLWTPGINVMVKQSNKQPLWLVITKDSLSVYQIGD
jgi:hypothetical protein